MKQEDAKRNIISEFLKLPEQERTETEAVLISFKHSGSDSLFPFKCSGDKHQAIMGWLTPYIKK